MENWRCGAVGLLVALALGGIAPTQAFDIRDVQYFRANGYRSCQQCNLSGADLQHANLLGADLRGAFLSEANLQDADLSWANLQDADLSWADLQDADLSLANLQDAKLSWANLQDADLSLANLQDADLSWADLQDAFLSRANLQDAKLIRASLQDAFLSWANLQDADLSLANLQDAKLIGASLQDADLSRANLQDAKLIGAKVANAQLANANLMNAIYAPASAPPNGYVAGVRGISSVVIPTDGDVIGLVQLRKLLQDAGLPEEREATYAIEHSKTDHLLWGTDSEKQLQWNEPLALAEGAFRWLAFEWPVGYGLYPGHALRVLAIAIVVFSLIYAVALATETGSLYRVWPAGRIESLPDSLADEARLEPLRLWGRPTAALGRGLQFSLLSAFHLGFRELNVGTWLARVQAREYGLQAVGWVRVLAGLQSLLSVYLLAMWLLTYFGRPFG